MDNQNLKPQYTGIPQEELVKGILKDSKEQAEYFNMLLKDIPDLELIGGNTSWLDAHTYHYQFIFKDLYFKKVEGDFLKVRQRQNQRADELVNLIIEFTDGQYQGLKFRDSRDKQYITINFSAL